MANLSRVLYDNALTQDGVTVTYNSTLVDGFGLANLTDGKDFSLFKAASLANGHIKWTMPVDTTINYIGLYMKYTSGAGSFDAVLMKETGVGTNNYGVLHTLTNINGLLICRGFNTVTVNAGERILLKFNLAAISADVFCRQVMVGEVLTMERGQYAGVNPPTLSQGAVMSNNISENGSILGSNTKRVAVKSQIEQNHCTESFVRNSWEPFAAYAAKGKSFFYQWNYVEYIDEAVFCVAEKIVPPINITPTPLMKVSMPIICLQADPTS